MAKRKGFYYSVEKEILKDCATWPVELKLKWLYMGNLLRKTIQKILSKFKTNFVKEKYEKSANYRDVH